MPQYQGVWSLQSAAQLQSTQRWVTDPLFENTTLLLQADPDVTAAQNNTFLDSSSNNFAITRNGNTTQGSFTPFSSQPGAWSNYFDGTGFLSFTNSTDDDIASGDFTIELWVYYPTAPSSSTYTAIYSKYSANTGFNVQANNANIRLALGNGTTDSLYTFAWTPQSNTWYHIAITRSGTNGRVFLNGSQIGTTQTVVTNNANSTNGVQIGRTHTVTDGIAQYISNARFVKGQALYTGSFTPATTPLTTTSVGSTGSGAASSITGTVGLLSCQSNRFIDNGSGATTISVGANVVSVQAFSPFAPQFQWTPSVIGGSGYFDGTTDYLSVASNTALTFGTGDFTVEGWFYANSIPTQPTILNNGSDAAGLVITMVSSKIYAYFVGAGNVFGSGGATIVPNTWYHFAWVRSGSTHTFYLNGAVYGATYSSAGNHSSTGGVGIGYSVAGTAFNAWNGYIANVRMVKGTAVYSGAFTPPIAPVTTSGPASSYSSTTNVNTTFTSTNTSLLTNFTNAGIFDGTMKNNLETVGNAQVSTAVVKYGSGSMFFDGTGDYLYLPSNRNLELGTGDFTLECWVYATSAPSDVGIFESRTDGNGATTNGFTITAFSSSVIRIFSGSVLISSSGTSYVNTWCHVAVTRVSGTFNLYINGVSQGTSTTARTLSNTDAVVGGGRYGTTGAVTTSFPGYIDDLRITKGIARYTQNFIPPSVALPRQ